MNILEPIDKSKICVAYEYKLRCETNASPMARNINKVFGNNVANKWTVHQWFGRFWFGDFSLENKPCGRPATKIDNDELKAVLEEDIS